MSASIIELIFIRRQTIIGADLLIFLTLIVIPNIHAVDHINNESPMHLLTSSNFTSYKLPVPGSDPITIIEANNRLPLLSYTNDNVGIENEYHRYNNNDDDDEAEATTLHQQYHSHSKVNQLNLIDSNRKNHGYHQSKPLTTTHRTKNNQKFHATIGLQVAEPESILPSSSLSTSQHYSNNGFMNETLRKQQNYSPILLEKFIKEYSEKIKNANENTRNTLKNLEKNNKNRLTSSSSPVINDRIDIDEDEQRLEQKYWDDGNSYNRRPAPSSANNPYNDRDGWITLDAVPWSTSKVSKWHPNKNPASDSQNVFNDYHHQKPSSSNHWDDEVFSRPPQPPPRPLYYNSALESDDDYNNYHDRFTTNKPVYTTYHSHHRPSPKPSSWHQQQQHDERPSSYDKKPSSYASRPRPYRYDYSQSSSIDTGSSAFNDNYDAGSDSDDHWYDNNRYKVQKPKPFNEDILTEESIHNYHGGGGGSPNRRPIREHNNHPYSHPDDGDGEWVLISTTKGYQGPNRQGNRAMTVQRFQPTIDSTTQHQSVKLTVYPTTNKTFSYDTSGSRRRKPLTLSHNGLLEVSPSFQSVDSAAEASNAISVTTAARRNGTKTTATKRKMLKRVPLKAQSNSQDSSAVLAAVGAGMVPATVAMLMPMVLGRKKRETHIIKSERSPIEQRRRYQDTTM